MHQSERVSSTSGNDKLDNNEANDNNNDEDSSDVDSWPEDSISANDSKIPKVEVIIEMSMSRFLF